MPTCSVCGAEKGRAEFARSQLKQAAAKRRCVSCAQAAAGEQGSRSAHKTHPLPELLAAAEASPGYETPEEALLSHSAAKAAAARERESELLRPLTEPAPHIEVSPPASRSAEEAVSAHRASRLRNRSRSFELPKLSEPSAVTAESFPAAGATTPEEALRSHRQQRRRSRSLNATPPLARVSERSVGVEIPISRAVEAPTPEEALGDHLKARLELRRSRDSATDGLARVAEPDPRTVESSPGSTTPNEALEHHAAHRQHTVEWRQRLDRALAKVSELPAVEVCRSSRPIASPLIVVCIAPGWHGLPRIHPASCSHPPQCILHPAAILLNALSPLLRSS